MIEIKTQKQILLTIKTISYLLIKFCVSDFASITYVKILLLCFTLQFSSKNRKHFVAFATPLCPNVLFFFMKNLHVTIGVNILF